MRFGLFYFADDCADRQTNRYDLLIEGARFADRNGFETVWTPERHFHRLGGLYPNPSVTGAAIAAITERVKIRGGSVVAPLHHPLRIAEEWSVVDNLSGGRAGVAFGSGWGAVDFALRPDNYRCRRQVALENIDQVRRLWRGESMAVLDGLGNTRHVRVYPPPVQRELPVWVTSSSAVETFRNAGRAGAGLLTHLRGQEPDELADKITEYRAAYAEHGRASGTGHVVLVVHTYLGTDEDEVRRTVHGPLCDYLRGSFRPLLGSRADGVLPADLDRIPSEGIDYLVEHAFDWYVTHGGLLGTVASCRAKVDRFRAAGVDEIACLIDFGLPAAVVLDGLAHLDELRATCGAGDGAERAEHA